MPVISDISSLSEGSHTIITVQCDFKSSPKCRDTYKMTMKDSVLNRSRNNGKVMCLFCSRRIKGSGRLNPNCKYEMDDDIFKSIDTEDKAYLLGWIGSDGHIGKRGFDIGIKNIDIKTLEILRDVVCPDLPISESKGRDIVHLVVNSQTISEDLCKLFKIAPGKKSHTINFPELNNESLTWAFVRGYFEGDGNIRKPTDKHQRPECSISSSSNDMLLGLKNFTNIKCYIGSNTITWDGFNALDFLGKLYDTPTIYRLQRKYESYRAWLGWQPSISYSKIKHEDNLIVINKTATDACIPSKARPTDSGYDLTIIKEWKRDSTVVFYDTCIKIKPPIGFYGEVFARSSLSKSGYILVNGVGIIDQTYNGTIIIGLMKIDQAKPDLKLPLKCAQIIFRRCLHFPIIEVPDLMFNHNTSRSDGAFGSTDSTIALNSVSPINDNTKLPGDNNEEKQLIEKESISPQYDSDDDTIYNCDRLKRQRMSSKLNLQENEDENSMHDEDDVC